MPTDYETRPGWALCYPKKTTGADWQADYTGVTVLDGRKFWVNIWEKTASDGGKLISVNIRLKEGK
jgi:hypothetical protein